MRLGRVISTGISLVSPACFVSAPSAPTEETAAQTETQASAETATPAKPEPAAYTGPKAAWASSPRSCRASFSRGGPLGNCRVEAGQCTRKYWDYTVGVFVVSCPAKVGDLIVLSDTLPESLRSRYTPWCWRRWLQPVVIPGEVDMG